MDIDVLITGVTGFVGRFVLLNILENHPTSKIGVLIRPTKDKSAAERFRDEIVLNTMFSSISLKHHMQNIIVISAALEDIEKTFLIVKKTTCIIHCAANVNHYDPYEKLERDNVNNVKTILALAEKVGCEKLVLLSTCYVHPRGDLKGEIARIPHTRREDFYNDYCYTKWLGEECVFNYENKSLDIHILRLSCVGAPLREDLLSHPFSAQAHLGVISFACRGYLQTLYSTSNSRISVIPVDITAEYIVKTAFDKKRDELVPQLHQVCPSPDLDAYHIHLPSVFSALQFDYGLNNFKGVISDYTRGNHLPWYYNAGGLINNKIGKSVELHEKIQDFVSTFSEKDIRFISSVSEFPDISEKEFILQTCLYSIRISQFVQFKKGVPISLSDKFWHRVAKKEPIQVCLTLEKGVPLTDIDSLREKLWNTFMSHRKWATKLENNKWIEANTSISEYFDIIEFKEDPQPDKIISIGLSHAPLDTLWKIHFIISDLKITHLLIQADHGITDGIGSLPLLKDINEKVLKAYKKCEKEEKGEKGKKEEKDIYKKRESIPFWKDLMLGLLYIALVILILLPFNDTPYYYRTETPSITTSEVAIKKSEIRTYTSNLLRKLTGSLSNHTKRPDHIFVVPAALTIHRSPAEIMKNDFVPILLPLSSDMSENAFDLRCAMLQSKSVRILSFCLQQLLELQEWDWLRDRLMRNVSAVVSSVPLGNNISDAITNVHIATTTPKPIPFCITAISNDTTTSITVRSHNPLIHSDKIAKDLEL